MDIISPGCLPGIAALFVRRQVIISREFHISDWHFPILPSYTRRSLRDEYVARCCAPAELKCFWNLPQGLRAFVPCSNSFAPMSRFPQASLMVSKSPFFFENHPELPTPRLQGTFEHGTSDIFAFQLFPPPPEMMAESKVEHLSS